MTEQSDDRPLGRFPLIDMGRLSRPTWSLSVVEAFDLTRRMRRVRFTGAFDAMNWRPGQDLVLSLPHTNGDIARRHYTIRALEGSRLDIDFVLHGDSPATAWARGAKSGATIAAQGPRGHTYLRDAAHHWFVGDETCLPGIFAMAESLPAGAAAAALIEISDETEQQTLASPARVELHWVLRNGERAGPSNLLLDRLRILAPTPAGAHAYIIGETSNVRAQRHYLTDAGFTRDQITAEGYWRPGRVGGHDHV